MIKMMGFEQVRWILDANYSIHPDYPFEIQTKGLLDNLSNPDSFLRESTFTIMGFWIRNGKYSDDELREMADQMCGNLHVGLGDQNTDTVFIRSFSALILAIIVDHDENCARQEIKNRNPFLSSILIQKYLDRCIDFFHKEEDRRSYIEKKEMAHSIVHGAELLSNFSYHRYCTKKELLKILEVLKCKITAPTIDVNAAVEDYVFSEMAYTVFLRNMLTVNEIETWLQSIGDKYLQSHWSNHLKNERKRIGFLNTRVFFQTFYFMVKFGISNKSVNAKPFYKQNVLKNRNEILFKIEEILHQFVKGSFYN